MNLLELVDTLDFDNDRIEDDNVNSISAVETCSLVIDRQDLLTFECDATQLRFAAQAFLVCRFKQPGATSAMYFNCRTNDFFCQLIYVHSLSAISASPR